MANNNLVLDFDISDLIQQYQDLALDLEEGTKKAIDLLAKQAHAHVVQLATNKLKSSKDLFMDNLSLNETGDSNWSITIKSKARWIDDGLPSGFDMLPGFLKSSKAKSGPNGKYLVIPFKHNNAPTKQTATQKALADIVKTEFSKSGLSYGNKERNPDGSPKIGLINKKNIANQDTMHPLKQGRQGPLGHQLAMNPKPQGGEGPSGRPYLWGLRSYQKNAEDKAGNKFVQKDIMTFRTASEKDSGHKWIHPGFKGLNSLEETYEWAKSEWENKLLPELLSSLGIK